MIEAVLFDLGDTLFRFDSSDTQRAVETAGRPVYEDLLRRGYRPPPFAVYVRKMKYQFAFAYLCSRISLREVPLVERLHEAHVRMDIRMSRSETQRMVSQCLVGAASLFTKEDSASAVVEELFRAGFRLGLISNTWFPGEAIDRHLAGHGLLEYFPVRVYSSEVRYMKPSREIFRIALRALGIPAYAAVYIGDHVVNDVFGAGRMGMKSILVDHGRGRRIRLRPDRVIRDLSEIPPLLRDKTL